MNYEIEKLGENLYEVRMPWWYIGYRRLVSALLEIQESGKVVTYVRKTLWSRSEKYLVCTTDKLSVPLPFKPSRR